MNIITGKNTKILREIAQPIETVTPDTIKLIQEMRQTMKAGHPRGIGLAAPQIGMSIRLFVAEINYTKTKTGQFYACINPEIVSQSKETEEIEEGCLSLPNITGTSTRKKTITITYLNEYGKKMKTKARGLLSCIFQHELDHLNGILFIDKAKNIRERISPLSPSI